MTFPCNVNRMGFLQSALFLYLLCATGYGLGIQKRFLMDPPADLFRNNCDCYSSNCDCAHGHCKHVLHNYTTHTDIYRCECYIGWTGETCNIPDNSYIQNCDCDKNYHSCYCDNGHCKHISHDYETHIDVYRCECELGWTGETCNKLVTAAPVSYETSSSTPSHKTSTLSLVHGTSSQTPTGSTEWAHQCGYSYCIHGDCFYDYNYLKYFCRCHQGWAGYQCNEELGASSEYVQCGYYPCLHGTCMRTVIGQLYCQCNTGWYGPICDVETAPHYSTDSIHTTAATTKSSTPTTTKSQSSTSDMTSSTTATLSAFVSSSTTSFVQHMTSVSNMTTTLQSETTSSSSVGVPSCDKFGLLNDLAKQISLSHQMAGNCSTANRTPSAAVPLVHCAVPQNPQMWHQGYNVRQDCQNGGNIPTYSPIATFHAGIYTQDQDFSGIFLGCVSGGFKTALQDCNDILHVKELIDGGPVDPSLVYTIS